MLKKKFAAIIALVLCLTMVLGACGTKEAPAPAETQAAATETQAAAPAETQAAAETEAAPLVDWEDMAEIEFYTFTFVPPADLQHIEDAINAIIEPAINTHINITMLDVGAFIAQIGMMIAGGERIDLMVSGFAAASYSAMIAQNQLMDISGIIEEYGQDALAQAGELIKATSVGDAIYAIPPHRDVVSNYYVNMREDVLEDLGLVEQARAMKSMADYEEILKAVQASEKWNYLWPTVHANGAGPLGQNVLINGEFADTKVFDTLGDTIGLIAYDEETGKVELLQATEEYAETAALLRDWQEKGYIYYDVANEVTSCDEAAKNDLIFSYISTAEYGCEEAREVSTGMDMVSVMICQTPIASEIVARFSWCVPVTAVEPEAAVAFVNFAMTNAEVNNLMAWGEEGVDFELDANGVAQYIPGNENPSYHSFDYSVPNQYLVYPWGTVSPTFREESLANLQSAPVSKFLGLAIDLSELVNETSACTNVIEEYKMQIGSGLATEEDLQAFVDKLYANGAQKIVDAYQAAADAWLAQ